MPSPWLAVALPPAAVHREGAPSPLPRDRHYKNTAAGSPADQSDCEWS